MKKAIFVIFLLVGSLCASCAPEPEPTYPPMKREIIHTEEEEKSFKEELMEQLAFGTGPSGSYINVTYTSLGVPNEQAILVDLFMFNERICGWNLGSIGPEERGEEFLYFYSMEGNCPELDPRWIVKWDVNSGTAEMLFDGEFSTEIIVYKTISGITKPF